jgi:AraC family transcriptional regulator
MRTDFRIEQVKIIEVPDTRVAVLEHHGDPALIGDSVRRFTSGVRRQDCAHNPAQRSTYFMAIRTILLPAHFRVDLCAAIDHDAAPNDPRIVTKIIPGGRCAVLRHIGGDYTFGAAFFDLCALWLPQSGEEPRDFRCIASASYSSLTCQIIRLLPIYSCPCGSKIETGCSSVTRSNIYKPNDCLTSSDQAFGCSIIIG